MVKIEVEVKILEEQNQWLSTTVKALSNEFSVMGTLCLVIFHRAYNLFVRSECKCTPRIERSSSSILNVKIKYYKFLYRYSIYKLENLINYIYTTSIKEQC